MKSKWLLIIALVAFTAVIFLPPIVQGYVYPNIGDDTATHMNAFDKIIVGNPIPRVNYYGYYIVGYPLDVLSRVFDVNKDTLFFWFNYLALFGVGVSLFYIFRNLMGTTAGVLALFLPVFVSYGVLLLFYSGVIFNIINIGIILPFACFFSIKWILNHQWYYAVASLCLWALFAVFHPTGLYLLFIGIVSIIAFVIYSRWKRVHILKRYRYIMIAIVCLGLSLPLWSGMPVVSLITRIGENGGRITGLVLFREALFHYMSPFLVILLMVTIGLLVKRWHLLVDKEKGLLVKRWHLLVDKEKLLVLFFSTLSVIVLPLGLLGYSPVPMRQGIDFAILLSVVAVILLSVVIRLEKHRMITILLVVVAVGGGVINLWNWTTGYNSALANVDVEAIKCVNELSGETYSVSNTTVDPVIYSRYVNKEYTLSGDIVITRNKPMKSRVASLDERDGQAELLAEESAFRIKKKKSVVRTLYDKQNDIEIIIYQ